MVPNYRSMLSPGSTVSVSNPAHGVYYSLQADVLYRGEHLLLNSMLNDGQYEI